MESVLREIIQASRSAGNIQTIAGDQELCCGSRPVDVQRERNVRANRGIPDAIEDGSFHAEIGPFEGSTVSHRFVERVPVSAPTLAGGHLNVELDAANSGESLFLKPGDLEGNLKRHLVPVGIRVVFSRMFKRQ